MPITTKTRKSSLSIDLVIVGEWGLLSQNTAETARKFAPQEVKVNIINVPFMGYNKSLNEGAKRGTSEIVGFLNNDLVFTKDWFEPLAKGLDQFDSVSPWCPMTHHRWWGAKVPAGAVESYEVGKCVAGWAIFMRRATWIAIGGFDERLEFWCCDNSYAEQLKAHGLKHALIPESRVNHLLSQTLQKRDRANYQRLTRDQVKVYNRLYNKNLFNLGH